MNHNQLLGVTPNASTADIQKAFRSAAMEIHPDHSSSPEAAEAFARIKEARDELMKRARSAEAARTDESVSNSAAAAVRATTNAAWGGQTADDLFDGMTPDEVKHVQELDRLIQQKPKRNLFGRVTESHAVRKHRRKINTINKRIMGKY